MVSPCGSRIVRGRGPQLLAAATDELVNAARRAPGLTPVFSPFSANTPQVFVDIDRQKAQMLGVPMQNVTEAIETYFGSTYVNDFNILGRTYHVTAQADYPFRKETADLARLQTRNSAGNMVMLGSVVNFSDTAGPTASRATISIRRPNCRATRCRAPARPRRSTTMKKLADDTLPSGFAFEWTDLSYQQVHRRAMRVSIFSRSACCSCSWCWPRNMAAGHCRSRSS